MTIAETVKKLADAKEGLRNIQEQYEHDKAAKLEEISALSEKLSMAKAGLDMERIEKGLQIIKIRGRSAEGPRRQSAIEDAIEDLASGGGALKTEFRGVKNYDRFGDQRCDCPYGMGPKHGSIVFAVELKERSRLLTPQEIEDAIYTLLNIDEVLKAKETA